MNAAFKAVRGRETVFHGFDSHALPPVNHFCYAYFQTIRNILSKSIVFEYVTIKKRAFARLKSISYIEQNNNT